MVKYYCDGCGAEFTPQNRCRGGKQVESRLGTTVTKDEKRLHVEVLHGVEGAWNTGEFCKYCILDALRELDDRPRAE